LGEDSHSDGMCTFVVSVQSYQRMLMQEQKGAVATKHMAFLQREQIGPAGP
jgi:hypothetical protein